MSIEFIGFLAHQEASESVVPHGPLVNPGFVGAYHSATPDRFSAAAGL